MSEILIAQKQALQIEYDIMKDKFEDADKRYNNYANANFEQNKLLLYYKETVNSKNILIEKYKIYLNDIYPLIRTSLDFIGLSCFVYVLAGILHHLLSFHQR